jgi:flagellar export protein FliJ
MRDPKRTGQLVDVYRLREEQAEVAVSTAGQRVEHEQQRQHALEQYLAEYAGAGPQAGALSAGALANRCAFVAKLADACRHQSSVVEQQQAGLSREFTKLQQRQTEHRRMEHLHASACDHREQDRRRQEQRAQDEAAMTQWLLSAG